MPIHRTPTFAFMVADELPELADMMRRSFLAEFRRAEAAGEAELAPYMSSDTFFHRWLFGCVDIDRYTIRDGGQAIVGGMVVWRFEDAYNVLGLLFIDPDWQDAGVGRRAWQFLEATYPDTARWSLRTPTWSGKNRYFYERVCGFQRVGESQGQAEYEKVPRVLQ